MRVEIKGKFNTERVEIEDISLDFTDVKSRLADILCKDVDQGDFYERVMGDNEPIPNTHPRDREFTDTCDGFTKYFKRKIQSFNVVSGEELAHRVDELLEEISESLEILERTLKPRKFNIVIEKRV